MIIVLLKRNTTETSRPAAAATGLAQSRPLRILLDTELRNSQAVGRAAATTLSRDLAESRP